MNYLLLDAKKRPKGINKQIQKELIGYIKKEVKKNHFPSRRELNCKFKISLESYFKNIKDLYEKAEEKYKLHANQNIKAVKAKILLEIILKNLEKFNLELIKSRGVHEKGIDILTKREDEKIGIEIKAYNKDEKIKVKDIEQVKRFIINEKLDKAIIITTSDKKDKKLNIPKEISLINYNQLIRKLNDKRLNFIREYSINREDLSRKIKRQKILDYVLEKYGKEKRKPKYGEILGKLHLDLYTYFNSLFEIYKILKIPPPLRNMGGKGAKNPDKECIELWKNEFKKYILKEVKEKNRYPSGEEISKYFKISHIWNITNMSTLYKELGLKPYLERKRKLTFS